MYGKRNGDIEFNVTIGKLMERRRLAEGLTRRQVLSLMDEVRSTSLLCNYETGSKPVALPFALKWCEVMGIALPILLEAVERDMERRPATSAALADLRDGSH